MLVHRLVHVHAHSAVTRFAARVPAEPRGDVCGCNRVRRCDEVIVISPLSVSLSLFLSSSSSFPFHPYFSSYLGLSISLSLSLSEAIRGEKAGLTETKSQQQQQRQNCLAAVKADE